ncbi:hypothetical protein QTP70_014702 [Hemibagrus guttatus]|uniref:Uncharacterized protein n=1 Tax=Hemibagrus guttatus TaxID=175788 RepID=A0AAE0QI47_9TELE|nr:hypothetical protein QTP70_014702 [Hemibagrus guttatus]KAK3549870.1 hypothetical protein QTP86_015487 [Hemibagrus guttatus]
MATAGLGQCTGPSSHQAMHSWPWRLRRHATTTGWKYDPGTSLQAQKDEILCISCRWLQPNKLLAWTSSSELSLPRIARLHSPTFSKGFLERLEYALATLEIGRDSLRKFQPPPRWPQPPRTLVPEIQGERRKWDSHPAKGPVDEPMLTDPELLSWGPAPKTWLAGCALHDSITPKSPRVMIELNGHSLLDLLDSGSTIALVQSTVLHETAFMCAFMARAVQSLPHKSMSVGQLESGPSLPG